MKAPKDFADYAAGFPPKVRRVLQSVRSAVKKAAPDAQEIVSYKMPAFRQGKILVWFGAHANHIGFYPGAEAMVAFKKEFDAYKHAKGSVQFQLDEPMPFDLIARIVRYRVKAVESQRRSAL
ncbi:MAG TPA: DUF1801 domain-containing protein [Candidatus Baltobacteraceae bacterium]|jgi:uncharacterized protein YdhG (YjbR/CyaY superfamily)|nr:DUF1801 domain-containing protein [Candidatus Baltobacteraceae bacterium]